MPLKGLTTGKEGGESGSDEHPCTESKTRELALTGLFLPQSLARHCLRPRHRNPPQYVSNTVPESIQISDACTGSLVTQYALARRINSPVQAELFGDANADVAKNSASVTVGSGASPSVRN